MLQMIRSQVGMCAFAQRLLDSLQCERERQKRRLRRPRARQSEVYVRVEHVEDRVLLSGSNGPFGVYELAPGDDPFEAFARLNPQTTGTGTGTGSSEEPLPFTFLDNDRWSTTATNGGGLVQGDPTTLTWGFLDDGTTITGSEGTSASDLIAFLDGIYGNVTPDTNYTDEIWFQPFNDYLNRWGEVSGLSYQYEVNDSGAALDNTTAPAGSLGTVADLRIGGHFIDGESGSNTLAYNYFPNHGDMVIDTGNPVFYGNTSGNSIRLRNVLSHEHGHGIGLGHVCPLLGGVNGRLMEPFINTSFDGPQFDDILATQRGYGDALEKSGGNDTSATAHNLGTLTAATSLAIGTQANDTFIAPTDTDLISIDDDSDTDFFSFTIDSILLVDLLLTPQGPSYLSGPQNGDGSCSAGTTFNSAAQSDLTLTLVDSNGSTILSTANASGIGGSESMTDMVLTAGTYYVRVTGAQNAIQMYQLDLSATTPPHDFGDAPNAAQSGFAGSYPVTTADDGARHRIAGPQLGLVVDEESDGTHSADATADDTTGSPDDEDGVTFGGPLDFTPGLAQTGMVDINLQNADPASNRLDAWIDFNRDGDWNDPGEQIFDNFDLGTTNGVQTLTFTIPAEGNSDVVEGTTYSRFRVSSDGDLDTTGAAFDGEVEDHAVELSRAVPLLITEIMFNPDSSDADWEWVEVYNEGTDPIDLAGFVLDDLDGAILSGANIASGSVPGRGYAVLHPSSVSGSFLQAWRPGVNTIAVSDWPDLGDNSDTVGLWAGLAAYGSRDAVAAAARVAYQDNTDGWPAVQNGASFYLRDLNAAIDAGSSWDVSVDGTAGAYTSEAEAGNTGGDVGSPGFGTADAVSDFVRVDPFGSLVYVSDTTGTIGAGETLEFSVFLDGGQTLTGQFDVDVPGATVSIDLVGLGGNVSGAAGQSSVVTPIQQVSSAAIYIVRVTSDTAAGFDLSLLRNAVLESTDSRDGFEQGIDETFLGSPGTGRWAAVGTSSLTSGPPFNVTQSSNPGQFIDISVTGTQLTIGDERTRDFVSTVGNAFFPAGILSVSDNGVLAAGSGIHGRFLNRSLPDGDFTAALVPFWDDFFGATVYWEEREVGGIDTLIVQWHQADHFEVPGNDSATFQVQVFSSGPIAARYAYSDVSFGAAARDGAAAATVGFQTDVTRATQFAFNPGTAVLADGDVLDFTEVVIDIDEFEVDLTGHAGETVDILLTGISGQNFEGQTLQLLDVDGTTILATASATPLAGAVNADNADLAILDFTVPADGVYTLRTEADFADAEYSLLVEVDATFDVEPNNNRMSDPLRNITDNEDAAGFLDAATDSSDFYTIDLTTGTAVSIETAFPVNRQFSPLLTLDPELEVFLPDGTPLVSDMDSGTDGVSAELMFVPAVAGTYYIRVGATSGLGEYRLTTSQVQLPALVVTPTDIDVNEGGTNTFSVALDAQPLSDVTVTVSRTAGDTDLSVSAGGTLTFTPSNWDTPQDVTVAAAEDDDAADGTATLTVSSAGLTSVDVTADEVDNDTQGLTVTPTDIDVNEDGTNTFSVVLDAQPLADVTVTVSRTAGDADLSVSAGGTLTFTPSNWDTPQDVTVAAAEDDDAADGTATLTVSSAGLTSVDVTAEEVDNDTQGLTVTPTDIDVNEGGTNTFSVVLDAQPLADVTVTVSRTAGDTDLSVSAGGTLTFTPSNWDTPQDVTVAAAEDDDAADGTATLTVSSAGLTSVDVTADEVDNDTQGLTVTPTDIDVNEGGTNTFSVVLDAQPLSDVTVAVSRTAGDADLSVSAGGTLTFTPSNWDTPQDVTVAAAEDDDAADGTATLTVSSAGLTSVDVTAEEVDNDTQGLTVTPTDIDVNEGGTNTFSVVLDAQPLSDVTVTVSRTAGDADLSVSAGGTLTFTPSNWDTPQDVTVAAAEDDDAADGTATLTVSSAGLTSVDVTADEVDNDTQGLTVTPTDIDVNEGGTNTFSVVLDAQPLADVTVTVSRTAGDADLTVSAGDTLTFTPSNWDTPQDVTVAAAEDDDAADGTATLTVSSAGLTSVDVMAEEVDNDTQGLTVTPTDIDVNEGGTNTFSVVLDAQPLADVTVTVSRTAGDADLSVSAGGTLTFTPSNWDTPQDVTVAAAEDDDAADGTATLTVSSAGLTSVT